MKRFLGATGWNTRTWHLIFIAITIPLGLASRVHGLPMPGIVRTYGGDTLSAVCIFFVVRFATPSKSIAHSVVLGFSICVLIEIQQLYKAPWLVHLRNDTPLGILLGHGWLWSDIVCYLAGSLLGASVTATLDRQRSHYRSASEAASAALSR